MRLRAVAVIALAFALLAVTGCARLDEALTPPPKVVTEEATVAADGASVVGELSADTPQGLPLWPGAQVVESVSTDDSYSLTMTTGDPYEDVLAGVAAGFEAAGWDVTSEESTEGGRVAVLTLATDGQEGFVTITEVDGALIQLDYVLVATE